MPDLTDDTVKAAASAASARRPVPRELMKILGDCRDLAIHRLLLSFSAMLDRVGDMMMERASKTDVRDEQSLYLDARQALKTERANLMAEFEKRLRGRIDDIIAGKTVAKLDLSTIDATKLTLIDTTAMDASVVTGNIKRVVENLCYDELMTLNGTIGYLLGRPELETDANPLAPGTIVDAFADALGVVKTEERIKFQILKELNQASLGDINAIYADLNRHLLNLRVVPGQRQVVQRGGHAERARAAPGDKAPAAIPPQVPPAEVDVMALFRRMFGNAATLAMPPGMGYPAAMPSAGYPAGTPPMPAAGYPAGMPMGTPVGPPPPGGYAPAPAGPGGLEALAAGASLDFPAIEMPGAGAGPVRAFGPLPPTMSGYVPGAPIMSTAALHEGLTRLQAGQTGFDVDGAQVRFAGIPQGLQNVLRDLQDSPLGKKANQLESMTIEMVAMLFDFIFETRDLPDGIKALLARLQIPVLKAAMLDGAFFAKKTHPARMLVNELAQAGLGWSPVMGNEDPLYAKIDGIVHAILDGFSDNLDIFEELRRELAAFLAEEEKAAESNIASSAEEINQRDRREIAAAVAKAETERRIENYPIPSFLASFLRQRWLATLEHVYLTAGEDSEGWSSAVTTMEDLVWSVQPKRSTEDRRHLVALLPSLLKRLNAGLQGQRWTSEEREHFMANLVEAHAAAVKPSLAHVESPTAAVAEQAKAQAEVAKAAGNEKAAKAAEALAVAMAPAEPLVPEPEPEILDDEYLEIARSLERGMWVEFEAEGGQLAFAKLAWVSPLRGTYLFTNRQGQKALSITAEELAGMFRTDRARMVEAEPLIDRAFSSMMTQLEDKLPAQVE